ncbi:MAG: translation initiation factor [Flavobacteriales bacterium]|nr:translation initiation factor [Flavobacteriales bacterium]
MSRMKDELNFAYSTDPSFNPGDEEKSEALENKDQNLKVALDRKNRKGKVVTVISGFIGTVDEMKLLEKKFKNKFGVGGSVKNGEIIIQGDYANNIIDILKSDGFNVKRI